MFTKPLEEAVLFVPKHDKRRNLKYSAPNWESYN